MLNYTSDLNSNWIQLELKQDGSTKLIIQNAKSKSEKYSLHINLLKKGLFFKLYILMGIIDIWAREKEIKC